MTRWAFVSDVHGNRRALALAEEAARAAMVDVFISLGDIIGRGDPEGCVAWVGDTAKIAIAGNRDLDYLQRVSPELQRVVSSWPHEGGASDFVVSHGDARLHRALNSAAERDGFRRVGAYLAERSARVWFFGHTHRSRCWELRDGQVGAHDPALISMRVGSCYVVNVGTTGLPLPGRGGAAWVLYDDQAAVIRSLPIDLKRRRDPPEPYAMISEALQEVR